jgi:hypothetical protein
VQLGIRENVDEYLKQVRVDKPFPMAPVVTMTAQEAYQYVLNNVGASLPKRDAVDNRIVEVVKTGKIIYKEGGRTGLGSEYVKRRLPADTYKKGIITDISQVGGYPEYKGKPYKDADNDGMPDAWEKKVGLNARNSTDASQDRDNDGYTNIEEYINSVVPLESVKPQQGLASN